MPILLKDLNSSNKTFATVSFPANCFPEGQENIAKRGMLRRLEPGEVVTAKVKLSMEML